MRTVCDFVAIADGEHRRVRYKKCAKLFDLFRVLFPAERGFLGPHLTGERAFFALVMAIYGDVRLVHCSSRVEVERNPP